MTPSPTPTPVGAPGWLAEIKERASVLSTEDLDRAIPAVNAALITSNRSASGFTAKVAEAALATYHPVYRADVAALAAALEAVLALADGWDARTAELRAEGRALARVGDEAANLPLTMAMYLEARAKAVREAIEATLRDAQDGAV